MSAIAPQKSEPNFPMLALAMAVPLMIGFVIFMALLLNDSFLSQDINTKSITIMVVCFGSIGVMLICTTIWAAVYRRMSAAVIVWAVVVVGAIMAWLLIQLQHAIMASF